MEILFDWFVRTLIPWSERFSKNKYVVVIRNTFFTMIPFWMIMALFTIIQTVLLDPSGPMMGESGLGLGAFFTGGLYGEDYLASSFARTLHIVYDGMDISSDLLLIFVTLTFASNLADLWGANRTLAALCSLGGFLMLAIDASGGVETRTAFGSVGITTSLVSAVIATRIFSWLSKLPVLRLRVPKSMPPELIKTLEMFVPAGITLLIFGAADILQMFALASFGDAIEDIVASWIFPASQLPLFALFYEFLISAFWWMGLHGQSAVVSITSAAYIPTQLSNQMGEGSYIFTQGFFAMGMVHTLALAIAILVFSRNESWRRVVKFCILPLIFNVQEPLIFGLPVVLNPLFLVPYILAPLVNTAVSWVAISWGIVPVFKFSVPWTMPAVMHGTLGTGSFMGGVLEMVMLILDIFIYALFVIVANQIEEPREEKGGPS